MTTYHIDPLAGSDANTGLSWAQAYRTMLPISRVAPAWSTGDKVKIAKTPTTEIVSALTFPIGLSGVREGFVGYQALSGWRVLRLAVDASIADDFVAMDDFYTGWTAGAVSPNWVSVSSSSAYSEIGWNLVPYGVLAAGTKLMHKVLPATLNLSGFTRLEIPVHFSYNANNSQPVDEPALELRLCSDTAGNTSVLSIPIRVGEYIGELAVYEGSLPANVNSIAIHQLSTGVSGKIGKFYLKNPVATRALTAATYIGYTSLAKLGDHEAAEWCAIDHFHGGYVAVAVRMTGNASEHAGSRGLRFRKSFGWAGWYGAMTVNYSYQGTPNDITITPFMGIIGTFSLPYNFGSVPFVVEGGYNPATGLVDGRTFLRHDMNHIYGYAITGIVDLTRGGSVTFRNFVIVSNGGVLVGQRIGGIVRFEECEIYTRHVAWSAGYAGQTDPILNYYVGSQFSIHSLEFQNCKGSLYGGMRLNINLALLQSVLLDNCVITGYNIAAAGSTYNRYSYHSSTRYINGLKMYCVPAGSVVPTQSFSTRSGAADVVVLPNFASDSEGVLTIVGAGNAAIGFVSSAFMASVVIPRIVLENTRLEFHQPAVQARDSSVYLYAPTHVEITNLEMSFVYPHSDRHTTGGEVNDYVKFLLSSIEHAAMCTVRVANLSVTGEIPYDSTAYFTAILGPWAGAGVQVRNLTVPPGGRWVLSVGGITQQASIDAAVVEIIDGAVLGQSTITTQAPLLSSRPAITDVRGVSASYTNGAKIDAVARRVTRLADCVITNVNAASLIPAIPSDWTNLTSTLGGPTHGRALVLDGSAVDLSGLDALYYASVSDLMAQPHQPVVVTTSTSHIRYGEFGTLETDYAEPLSLPHSWKSTIRRITTNRYANMIPLASLPVTLIGQVTVTLALRRSTSVDNHVSLLVFPNGARGAVGADYLPVEAKHTGADGEWQTVAISFTTAAAAQIDVYVSHYGMPGGVAHFDNLKVVEL